LGKEQQLWWEGGWGEAIVEMERREGWGGGGRWVVIRGWRKSSK